MRARGRSNDLAVIAAAGVVMAALAIVSFLLTHTDTAPRVPGSSYSAQPAGTKAAYLLLKELGHDIDRSFEAFASLRVEPPTTLLVIANPSEPPSNQDKRAVRTFVEQGGVVVAFGRRAGTFLPGVEIQPARRDEREHVATFSAKLPGALTRAAPEVSGRGVKPPEMAAEYAPAYTSASEVAIVTARFGAGQVIWWLDHAMIENDRLARADNVQVLVNAAGAPGGRTVLWDEYYHGERRSLWSYLAGTPLGWGVAQLGFAALAAFIAVARRRGPLRARFVEPRTSPLEFVDTMGSLYERAGASRAVVEMSRARLRRHLAAASGLPPATRDAALVAAAAARTGIDGDRLMSALSEAADTLRRTSSREKDVVAVVAELQELSAAVSAARAGRRDGKARVWRHQ